MSTTKEFLTRFNQAWADQDIDTIVNSVTDDVHFRMATDDKGIHGKEAFATWIGEMSNADYKMQLTTERFFISGDEALLSGRMHMTERDGSEREFCFCDLYTLRDNKVSAMVSYFMNPASEDGCPATN
ncbi:nuclear transport factor 2 family protein [Aliidiomarina soli]|uniref:SnoaL-like domain-containing protein n=1 Tax=Aliidiomarina soli TaxID=1928574 RepID=A0A432WF93_9GAMM|nr:nuclear transport factor 2 family protein [Aliidiomarina soli]RUO32472.1 hypothetical protein CWE14_10015 [Aliidiomarina soli]